MKKRFALVAMMIMAGFSSSVFAQIKGIAKEEVESKDRQEVAPTGYDFKISPDGKQLAYFSMFKDAPNVFVIPVNGGTERQVSYVGDAGVSSFYWLKNNLVAFVTAPGVLGSSALFVGDFMAGEYRRISAEDADARVLSVSERGGLLVYEMNSKQSPYQYDCYQISAEDMSSKSLFSNSSASIHWAGDLASGVSFGYVIDDGLVKLINPAGGKLNVLENCAQFEALAPSVIHKAQYYCISDNKRDGSALVELNLSDGKESQVLFAKPGCSVERVFLSAKDHRPVMVWYRGKENGFQLVDKTYSSLMEAIKSKIKGADKLQLTGCSSDENVWIVLQEFSDGRKIYYRYNVANKDIRQLNTVDTSYELKRAKIMMQTVPDTRGKELVLRFYSPPVEEIKYPAILVFGERMWSLNSSAHDSLLMALSLRGFPILEVDLLHSQSYGATALLNGYSWWSNMVVSDVPVMIAAINKMFPKIPGVVPCGFGIGAEMAMHTMSLHPDLKMRSVLIQPFFDAGVYANYLQKHGDDDLRFIVKGTEKPDETPAAHLGSAMNPMIIYSTVDTELAEILNPVIHSLSLSGNAPAIMNYSDDAGLMSSAQTLAQAVTEITQYIGAVPVRKTK